MANKVEQIKQEKLEMQKCRKINDPLDTYVAERISVFIAKFFIKRNASPNTVTLFSTVLGILGSVCLIFSNIWTTVVGVIVILFSYCFDCADGQVARALHKGSLYGRCFDGFSDGIVYFAIYICVGVRLMLYGNIPFTNIPWNGWIWLIVVPTGVYFHAGQSRIADYYKNVYMYLCDNSHCELSRSNKVKEEVKKDSTNWFKKLVFSSYISYTKSQEKNTPNLQKLLQKIDENNGVVPEKVSQMWMKGTNHTIILTNILVFNYRTYLLGLLLILGVAIPGMIGLEFWLFPIVVILFEAVKIFLIVKYEK
ncbi:MAG: CDP-alcohol phosphatidyltransferase family protein, partial [Bacilli bacterium]|nr:CDP-alcohol phosphatidyltransferase family protein [Bacilli bacterium]